MRSLTCEEAGRLAVRVAAGDPDKLRRAEQVLAKSSSSYSLASVYKAVC